MISYTEWEVGIKYIGGKTIAVRSWGFYKRFYLPTQLAIKVTVNKLALEGRMQGANGLIRTTRSSYIESE